MVRLPKRLQDIEDSKTLKTKILDITNDPYFDPYNGTESIAKMLIKEIDKELKIINKKHRWFLDCGERNRVEGRIQALEKFKGKLKQKKSYYKLE